MISRIKLLELMSARMFHDLAGPIGAVHNSVEFLGEGNEIIKEKALNIIKSSSGEAIIRLKFFRQAYGTVGESKVYLNNIASLVDDFLKNTKLKITWKIQEQLVSSYIAKAIMNLIVIATGSLIHGGEVIVEQLNNGVKLLLHGDSFIFNDDTEHLLAGEVSNITLSSANIQIYYTYMMIEFAKAKLSISKRKQDLEFLVLHQE